MTAWRRGRRGGGDGLSDDDVVVVVTSVASLLYGDVSGVFIDIAHRNVLKSSLFALRFDGVRELSCAYQVAAFSSCSDSPFPSYCSVFLLLFLVLLFLSSSSLLVVLLLLLSIAFLESFVSWDVSLDYAKVRFRPCAIEMLP